MGNVLIAFSTSLFSDLSERPGRNKIEKEKAAEPRSKIHRILWQLSCEMQHHGGTSHLRADLFAEPIDTLCNYTPGPLADLLINCKHFVPMPSASAFAGEQPHGYIAAFEYTRVDWWVIAGYVEMNSGPVLVMIRALKSSDGATLFASIAKAQSTFDHHYQMVLEAARDAS